LPAFLDSGSAGNRALPRTLPLSAVLHDYDIDLTDYAIGNVVQYLPDKKFARWVVAHIGSPSVLEYLRKRSDRNVDAEQIRELLCDTEMAALESTFEDGPPGRVRDWVPYVELHRRYISTVREVRDGLSRQTAEEWSADCSRFAEELEEGGLTLHAGLKIVRKWIQRLRDLQLAMGAEQFVPPGDVPKGHAPAASPTVTPGRADRVLATSIRRMREAIERGGADAKSESLIKIARIRPTEGLRALRALEKLSVYKGFQHPPHKSGSSPRRRSQTDV
jgi:hypothetical protein